MFIARKFVFGKHSSVAAFEDASPGKASVNAKGRDGQPAEAMALVFLTEKPQGKLFIDLRGQRGEDGGDGGYGDKPDDNDVPQKRLIGQHAKSEPITVKDFFERSFANIHNSKEFNADDKRKKKEQEATLLENKRLFMTQNCHGLAEPECLTTRYMFWCTDPLLNDIEGEGGYRNYGKAGKSGGNGGDGGFLRAIIVSNDEKLQFTESDYLEFETSRGKKGIPGNVGPDSLAGPGGDGRDADAYNACPQPVVGSRPQYKDKSGPPVSPDFAKDGIAPEKIITVQTYSRSWWPFTD